MRPPGPLLALALLAVPAAIPLASHAQEKGKCPILIGLDAQGHLFTDRFHGWYRTTLPSLEANLQAGCYNDSHPAAVSSVTVQIVAAAPPARVQALLDLLARHGWPQDRLLVQHPG